MKLIKTVAVATEHKCPFKNEPCSTYSCMAWVCPDGMEHLSVGYCSRMLVYHVIESQIDLHDIIGDIPGLNMNHQNNNDGIRTVVRRDFQPPDPTLSGAILNDTEQEESPPEQPPRPVTTDERISIRRRNNNAGR